MKYKGQNIRLAIEVGEGGSKKLLYFAAASSSSINVNADTEETSTKDDVVDSVAWRSQQVVGKNWDCSCEVQVVDETEIGTDGIGGFDLADMVGQEVVVEVNIVGGEKNRTKTQGLYTGKALITSWSATMGNRQTATASVSMTGQGALTKVSA